MVACGNYMMQPEELERYRQAVAADSSGEELSEIRTGSDGADRLPSPGGAEPLKTAPRGFPRDHPRADLLRQKGLIANAHTAVVGPAERRPAPHLRRRDL